MDKAVDREIIGLEYLYRVVFAIYVIAVVLPVIYTIGWALLNLNGLDLDFSYLSGLLLRSVFLAGCVGFFSVLFGSFLAFLMYKTNSRNGLIYVLLLLPLFLPPYFMAVGWRDFFVTILSKADFLYSLAGVGFVLTLVYTPLSMLIIGGALRSINRSSEEAGLIVTGLPGVFMKIIFPQVKPALLSSFVLVFVFALSEFSVPSYFGVRVFSTEIFTQFSAFYDFSLAILESGVLILVSLVFLLTELRYLSKAPFMTIGLQGQGSKVYGFPAGKIFLWFWVILSSVLPLFSVTVSAVESGEVLIRAFKLLYKPAMVSCCLSLAVAVIMVFIGFVYAFYVRKTNKGRLFLLLMLLIFALPSATLGISLIKFYNTPLAKIIYSSFAIVIIGLTGKFLFISAKILENSLKQIPDSLDEAAALSGSPLFLRIIKIWIPLSFEAVFASFLIGFVLSFGELSVSIMVYPPGAELLPVKVFTVMVNAPATLANAMVLMVIVFTLLPVLIMIGIRRLIQRN